MLSFKVLNLITASISLTLFMLLLLIPEPIFWLFEVNGNPAAYFIARRTAVLFLGLAVIAYFSRHAKHSQERQAIILGLSCLMFGLVVLGTFEFVRGFVSVGIFLAVGAELPLTLLYGWLWFSHRKKLT